MNNVESSSNSSPVEWNLVFTSPTASPTVAISSGILPKMLSADAVNSASASPAAPVFVTIVSYPSSSSVNAATPAAPNATKPADTTDIFFPKFSIFVPAVSHAVANLSNLLFFNSSFTFSSSDCISMSLTFDALVFVVWFASAVSVFPIAVSVALNSCSNLSSWSFNAFDCSEFFPVSSVDCS